MLYAYMGTAAVIAILVGSVTLCVIWLSRKISTGIREKTVDILSTYDVLLEKKSRELARLEESILQLTNSATEATSKASVAAPSDHTADAVVVNVAERMSTVNYRETAVGQTYRKIRDTFQYDPRQVLAEIPEQLRVVQPGAATKLLEDLPYDTVFRLSMLDNEEQRTVLEESLTGEKLQLLRDYCGSRATFQIIDFYDHLQALASLEPRRPRLRVAPGYRGEVPEGVELVEDPDICEGFQIEVSGSIYDYCVKGRELG